MFRPSLAPRLRPSSLVCRPLVGSRFRSTTSSQGATDVSSRNNGNADASSPASATTTATDSSSLEAAVSPPSHPLPPSLNGSEPAQHRPVRIYSPARTAMQSGRANTGKWRIDFEPTLPKWSNPLMGWQSSSDTLQSLRLGFRNREEAIAFAQRQGWDYVVDEAPKTTEWKPKLYSSNFTYEPGKIRFVRTK